MNIKRRLAVVLAGLLATGCWGGRYISADADLEAIYVGKSYYEVVDDFGRPDASMQDGMEGSKIAYNAVSLGGTRAAGLYQQYNMRSRVSKQTGMPVGGITFSFDSDMKCYAVDSDFQRERTKEAPAPKQAAPTDPRRPDKVKPKLPRTLDYPYYESCSPYAEVVSIEKIEVDKLKTKVYFMYKDRTPEHKALNDVGLYLMPDIFIEDCATGQRSKMTGCEGITLYPERTRFARNQGGYDVLIYSVTFQPLHEDTEFVNIIEPGHSGFNFYKVDVRTPMTTKEQLKNQ